MSQRGGSERMVFLRRRVAAIETRDGAPAPAWPAPSGEPARDSFERLLQGLARGGFCEILPARPRDVPAAAGFAFALALRVKAGRGALVWIVEDMAAREIGLPHGRGLMAAGFDLARLTLVRTKRPRESFWAMEEALRSRAAAVIAESWEAPGRYNLVASRRLLLAARRGGSAGLLLLPRAAGEAARLSSAASLRFEVAALPPRAGEIFAPTVLAWRLRVAKARAGPLGAFDFDPLAWRDIAFDPATTAFRHAFSGRLSAPPCDRPADAPARA